MGAEARSATVPPSTVDCLFCQPRGRRSETDRGETQLLLPAAGEERDGGGGRAGQRSNKPSLQNVTQTAAIVVTEVSEAELLEPRDTETQIAARCHCEFGFFQGVFTCRQQCMRDSESCNWRSINSLMNRMQRPRRGKVHRRHQKGQSQVEMCGW